MRYLTKENIVFLIAVFGFVLSLYNFFKAHYDNKFKINLIYRGHWILTNLTDTSHSVFFNLVFENLSKQPVSISRLFIKQEGKLFEFSYPSRLVWEFTRTKGDEILDNKKIFTEEIPFNMEGLGAIGCYVVVDIDEDMHDNFNHPQNIELQINTNRGIKTVSIFIDKSRHDIEQYGYKG